MKTSVNRIPQDQVIKNTMKKETPKQLTERIYRLYKSEQHAITEVMDEFDFNEQEAVNIVNEVVSDVKAYNAQALGYAKVFFIFGKSHSFVAESLWEEYPNLTHDEVCQISAQAKELAEDKKANH